ncbi:MAG: hypothetical protein LUC88_00220 [Prevotella sp.]|nr:hypothetical protein [Prevotella sp.]
MNTIKVYIIGFIILFAFVACDEDVDIVPSVPYSIELNDSVYHNGDSLYGRVIINTESMPSGTNIKKIDCRLRNIVIGSEVNTYVCPFGVKLEDMPIGIHTLSVIVKCKAPGYDLTYWRYDLKMINIIK